ncbi:creatininase family protein [Streptomyces sp. NPDC102467]|uniref:creatininase family protein n=1 Tax=Streptomyces sp. NPDC102467 TaxID=3366179 RepID=UPI0038233C46
MSARSPLLLAELTTEEAAEAVTRAPVVIIPAGAYEQHGPGMPIATDTIRAERIAALVGARLAGRVVIGPPLPVGVSPHHMAFAGTVTLTTTTFAAVVREYVGSLRRHGWRRFLVLTGHGGNNAALTTVAQDLLMADPDVRFAWSPVTSLASGVVAGMGVSEVHGHSGEAETAQMLYLAPELVHQDRLAAGSVSLDELKPGARLARTFSQPSLTLPYDELSANGVLGDPTSVTADDGRAIVDAVVGRVCAFVEEWLDV